MSEMMRTYTELLNFDSFQSRLQYLKLHQKAFKETFGPQRHINQRFYKSAPWHRVRRHVLLRDNGCDLGLRGFEILGRRAMVHHMNPITVDDLEYNIEWVLNPEYLITVSEATHNSIHFGRTLPDVLPVRRFHNDTVPWRNPPHDNRKEVYYGNFSGRKERARRDKRRDDRL